MEKEEKIKYRVFTIRLSDQTIENLKNGRLKSGKSWNLYLVILLEKSWRYDDLCK